MLSEIALTANGLARSCAQWRQRWRRATSGSKIRDRSSRGADVCHGHCLGVAPEHCPSRVWMLGRMRNRLQRAFVDPCSHAGMGNLAAMTGVPGSRNAVLGGR